MKNKNFFWKKVFLSTLPLAFALFALLFPTITERKLDNSILFLILLAILIVILPWERLTSLKAAGIELGLDSPQIDKAIADLEVLKGKENINDESIRKIIENLSSQVKQVQGSRILWIDDTPDNILGERRLLRALGIKTIMAVSNEIAQSYLDNDGDFDLIISDMRSGDDFRNGKSETPEAVKFIADLQDKEIKRQSIKRYSHIPLLPVIFYSGKDYSQLLNLTKSIRGKESNVVLVKDVGRLLEETIKTLSYIHSEPIKIVVGSAPKFKSKGSTER